MKLNEVDVNQVSPMMKQYIEIKKENPDIILFFRLGDFYEMFFEDAINISHELELTLTGKNAGLKERIPMCGIPYHAKDIYLNKLVEKGYKIGICEQLSDPKETKGIVKRDIVKIITKGTLINEANLKSNDNNYLAALVKLDKIYSLCYLDLSTGDIYAEVILEDNVISKITSYNIQEIVVLENLDILTNLNDLGISVSYFNDEDINIPYKLDEKYQKSVKLILAYLRKTEKKDINHLKEIIIKNNNNILKMDANTINNLELISSIKNKDREYSLLWLLDKTKTAMGSRYLKRNILEPLMDLKEINYRLDIVTNLIKDFLLKEELANLLYEVYDVERLATKISMNSCNGRDLLQLKKSLKVLPTINNLLEKINFQRKCPDLKELEDILENSIYEEPPISLKEGYLIKEGYNEELDTLKSLRLGGKEFIAKFELDEREKTGIKNLKVGYNRVFGYYIDIPKSSTKYIKEEYHYERRQTLSNNERYISPILKEKEALILNAEDKIITLEYNLFLEIRNICNKYIKNLQTVSEIISEIDMLQSFATISEKYNYTRPIFNNENIINIKLARHPVIEKISKKDFIANDINMGNNTNVLLITGPNMSGKSTYMRTLGIIAVMAGIGMYVPAEYCSIPLFDAIYTRIGASDNLVSGESTFMCEMLEANYALKNATKNSLMLFDELGRGTATFDGMAIAQGILEYIAEKIGCKTLFSTHYHELTNLEDTIKTLKNIHVSAKEEGDNIIFLHKVKPGPVSKSYGIHVAKLANIPSSILKRSTNILKIYEEKENIKDIKIQEQLPLYIENNNNPLLEEIKNIDLLNITPIEALNKLYELKNKINK